MAKDRFGAKLKREINDIFSQQGFDLLHKITQQTLNVYKEKYIGTDEWPTVGPIIGDCEFGLERVRELEKVSREADKATGDAADKLAASLDKLAEWDTAREEKEKNKEKEVMA